MCAPAGFGKTTLVAEWVQTIGRPTAWLSLDEHDNELAVFVSPLVAALHTVFPDAFGATASLLTAPHLPPPSSRRYPAHQRPGRLPEAIVLVLDEYHSIHDQDVHTLLEMLITHLPSPGACGAGSRFDPPVAACHMVGQGVSDRP